MAWQLTYQGDHSVPVEIEDVIPDRVASLNRDEVARLPAMIGNRDSTIGELFDVQSTSGADDQIDFHGDLSGVHWIGTKMSRGTINVHGQAGRHVGSGMLGGRIVVHGDSGDWVGGEMQGGLIHVHGNAGHLVGAAYRGSRRGMTGGTILINGDVGNELGHTLRRGLIAVGGNAGDLIGFNMLAGTIMSFGGVGIRHGAAMKRGTLVFFGQERPPLLPTFRFACTYQPLALSMLLRRLSVLGFPFDKSLIERSVDLYNGDFVEGGRGEILLATSG